MGLGIDKALKILYLCNEKFHPILYKGYTKEIRRIHEGYTNFCDKREQSQACLSYAEQSKNHDRRE